MQLTTSKGNGIATRPRDAIPNAQVPFHEDQASLQFNAEVPLHTALRLQLAAHGVSVANASGGLLLTGNGVCQMGDTRAAWLLLRHLNRGRAAR